MPLDAERVAPLVDRHAAALRAFASQWSDSPEDLVQEAFCRLMGQRRSPNHPGPWLYQVVRNLARADHRGKRHREQREAYSPVGESYVVDESVAPDARAI